MLKIRSVHDPMLLILPASSLICRGPYPILSVWICKRSTLGGSLGNYTQMAFPGSARERAQTFWDDQEGADI